MSTNLKIILTLVFLTGMFLQNGNAVDKYSVATGNWNSTATWSLTSGGSSGAAVPVTGDVVIIEGSFNVTVNANTASLTSLTIDSLSTLTATVGFTVSATTITVKGLYLNGSTGTITGTMTVGNGGTYQHAINGGTIKTATWIAGSTCNVSGTTSSVPSGLNQSFKNFTWSSTNTSAISISPTAINGDFNITAGGGTDKYLRINTASFTIGGNLNLSGSANLQISNSTQRTLTVNGNFSMTNGTIDMATSTKVGTLNVKRDFSFTGGTIKSTLTSGSIVLNGTTSQTFTSGGTVTGAINYTVNNLAILQMADETTAVLGNAFTLNLGSTLGIKSNDGITTSGGTGNIQTTTRTYTATAHYIYNGTSAQFTGNGLTTTANLTINNTAGVTTSGDLAVNGILNLQSANASATQGSLEMSTFTLTMGGSATTTGTGDVTGIVKRTTLLANTSYSFGNQFTTMSLSSGGTLPTWLNVKIHLTSSHSWEADAVNRYYDITQYGGTSGTIVTLNLHYLDGELHGLNENNLDLFDYHVGVKVHDHGRSNNNITDKWVGLANLSLTYIAPSSSPDIKYWTLDTAEVPTFTWLGVDNVWTNTANWTGGIVPGSSDRVNIPGGLTYYPTLPSSTTIGAITIQTGGVLNATTGSPTLTISGGAGAWDNMGTFNAGTSTVIFTNAGATMSDPTNFYNVTVADGAKLTLGTDNVMRIAGILSLSSTGILDAATNHNTIEYNGASQTVINPNGLHSGYHNLILSGSGTKTMPVSLLELHGDFSMTGTVDVTASNNVTTEGNFGIGSGTIYTAGSFNHTIGGNFTSSGTFTSTGSTITMDGFTVQTITGSPAFDNLIISSYNKTVLAGNTTVAGDLTINSGRTFDLSTYTCNRSTTGGGTFTNAGKLRLGGGSGGQTRSNFPKDYNTITLTGGTVEYYGSSQTVYTGAANNNIIISGSDAVTMPSGDITLNDFELNNASGVTLTGNLTVNGILNLNNGLLTLGDKNLILGASATVTGSPSGTNMVVATGSGELRKVFTGTGTFEFPVGSLGTSLDYSPVTLNFTSGSFSSAYAGVKLSQGKYDYNSSTTSYLNRYWTISQIGITGFSCGVTLQYLAGDVVGNEFDIWCGKYSSGAWTLFNVANLDANQLSGTVTGFSTFTGGEQGVLPVSLSSLSSSVIGRNIKLNWITSSEKNNTGFEVERAIVTKETPVFTKTGFVSGKGTTNTTTNYSFEDRNLQTGKYQYRLKQIDHNGNFTYFNLNGEVEVGVPGKYDLSQNYPNPFNPVTKINFELPFDSKVKMIIYDVTGREIKTMVNEVRTAGYYTIVYDGSDISSGIYFYRIIANANGKDYISTKKMAIIK
ncbi:MAG: T9SS type A sorting domain-containing protein [Ignavibacteriae bacterium]|nr:T9SS type A sorting domain-containing protein [Ignavibacteriota bacterium]